MSFEDISKSLLEAVNSVLVGEASIDDLDSDLQKKAKSMLKKVKNRENLVLNAKTGDLQIVSSKEASKKDFLAIITEAIKEAKQKLRRGQVVMVELDRKIMVGAVIMNVTPAGWVAYNYRGEEFISRIKDIKITPLKKEDVSALGITESVDSAAVREIVLTLSNDSNFYKSNILPVLKNITAKMKSGKFDLKKTKPFAKRLSKSGIDRYNKIERTDLTFSKETIAMIGDELLDEIISDAQENIDNGISEENTMSKDNVNEVTTTDLAQDELDNNPNSIDASPEPNSAVGARRGTECPKQVDVLFDADYRGIASGSPGVGYRLLIQYPSGRTEFLPPPSVAPANSLEDLRVICEVLPDECKDVCIAAVDSASISPSDLPQYLGNGKQEQ